MSRGACRVNGARGVLSPAPSSSSLRDKVNFKLSGVTNKTVLRMLPFLSKSVCFLPVAYKWLRLATAYEEMRRRMA